MFRATAPRRKSDNDAYRPRRSVGENVTACDSALRFTNTIAARALSQGALRPRSRASLLRWRTPITAPFAAIRTLFLSTTTPKFLCRSDSGFSNLPASGHCQWLCHLARAVDEKLRRRRQCAVLQCDNANRSTRHEVDWQNFDGAFPATKSQNGFRSHREEVPLRDKSDPCKTGGRDHGRARKLKSHRPEHVG